MKQLILIIFPFLLMSCSTTLRYSIERNSGHPTAANEESIVKADEPITYGEMEALESSIETASYYADKFNGRKTSNGEIYNMHDLTAAHVSYPFNTICRVTNLKNQKVVIVRINDRKPDTNNRAIDLSLGAAKVIDMLGDGTSKVKVEVLEWGGE